MANGNKNLSSRILEFLYKNPDKQFTLKQLTDIFNDFGPKKVEKVLEFLGEDTYIDIQKGVFNLYRISGNGSRMLEEQKERTKSYRLSIISLIMSVIALVISFWPTRVRDETIEDWGKTVPKSIRVIDTIHYESEGFLRDTLSGKVDSIPY